MTAQTSPLHSLTKALSDNENHDRLKDQLSEVEKMEKKLGSIDLDSASIQYIEASLHRIREEMRHYESEVNHKISKYYSELRPPSLEPEKTVVSLCEGLLREKQEREKLIQFQELQVKQIQEQEKMLDSKENIQFSIPIEISETKKVIGELEKFIHVAKIKQKKRSEDLVKVQKTNLEQFERTAMLRTNLEHAMLYEINLNERQMKIEERAYDFETKIEVLDKKLERLGKEVQERNILVSSNKHLLLLKDKKLKITKARDDECKRLALLQNTVLKTINSLSKEIGELKIEIRGKQERMNSAEELLASLTNSNKGYLTNQKIKNILMKNISFNYAETLLKMKKEVKMDSHSKLLSTDRPLSSSRSLEKPNFKIKKIYRADEDQQLQRVSSRNEHEAMYQSMVLSSKNSVNPQKDKLKERKLLLSYNKMIRFHKKQKEDQIAII